MVDTFYKHGRPHHPTLEEDRPRGGRSKSVKHRAGWSTGAIVLAIIVVILAGIAFFP